MPYIYWLYSCDQIRKMAEATLNSMVMKYGLSIINIGVSTKRTMNVVALFSGLFRLMKHANRNKNDMDI